MHEAEEAAAMCMRRRIRYEAVIDVKETNEANEAVASASLLELCTMVF